MVLIQLSHAISLKSASISYPGLGSVSNFFKLTTFWYHFLVGHLRMPCHLTKLHSVAILRPHPPHVARDAPPKVSGLKCLKGSIS